MCKENGLSYLTVDIFFDSIKFVKKVANNGGLVDDKVWGDIS